jgi:hypothetical protein
MKDQCRMPSLRLNEAVYDYALARRQLGSEHPKLVQLKTDIVNRTLDGERFRLSRIRFETYSTLPRLPIEKGKNYASSPRNSAYARRTHDNNEAARL